jgi:hypothetical protein
MGSKQYKTFLQSLLDSREGFDGTEDQFSTKIENLKTSRSDQYFSKVIKKYGKSLSKKAIQWFQDLPP